MKSISLYIHIPFCKSKCNYCDFLSFAGREENIEGYVEALIEEIRSHSSYLKDRSVTSIFIGGGTPSMLPGDCMRRIMDEVYKNFRVEKQAEISMESNPGSLTREKIEIYKASGINRVSMGLQSADEEQLKELGRIHSYKEFEQNYHLLREVGYKNINIDLMFGLPQQTLRDWKQTLEQVIALHPEHISIYSLLIEEGTPFYEQSENNELVLPDEELERRMYWEANRILQEKGYEHYEISNYSKKGFECQHNKVYWELGDYIGMGIGSASYFDGDRMENIVDLDGYIHAGGDLDVIIAAHHHSTELEKKEEFIFLGLRLIKGISKREFFNQFSEDISKDYDNVIKRLMDEELIIDKDDTIRLTSRGFDISNYVLAQFLQDKN